jgi:hypothetical protein
LAQLSPALRNAKWFLYVLLANWMNYAPMDRLVTVLVLEIPSHTAFHQHQKGLMEPNTRWARASCDQCARG